jgi:hypothetical protein
MDHLHWQYYFVEMSATVTEYVLAMATLGSVTRSRNNPYLCRDTQGSQGKNNGECHLLQSLALSR